MVPLHSYLSGPHVFMEMKEFTIVSWNVSDPLICLLVLDSNIFLSSVLLNYFAGQRLDSEGVDSNLLLLAGI